MRRKNRRIRYNKRPGGEKRGNNKDRRARKVWMLKTFGDGGEAPCTHCERPLDYHTVTADRIDPGGSYRRENIVPSCWRCNKMRDVGLRSQELEDKKNELFIKNFTAKAKKNPFRFRPAKRMKKSKRRAA